MHQKNMNPSYLIMFDFDLTLSSVHVFKTLAGWSRCGSIKPPYAISEVGQTMKTLQLDKQFPGGFAQYALGGIDRILALSSFLSDLHRRNCEMVVCSKGLVGPIRKILREANLLHYFSCVYANTGTDYGTMEFDDQFADNMPDEVKEFIGGGAYSHIGGKEKLMKHLLGERGLPKDCGFLVEDDSKEIEKARPYCQTFYVDTQEGLTSNHMHKLFQMVARTPETRKSGSGSGRRNSAPPANAPPDSVPGVKPTVADSGTLHVQDGNQQYI